MGSGGSDVSQCLTDNSGKLSPDHFNIQSEFPIVPKLCFHWASANLLTDLPSYEDVALGSVGRIADELALLRPHGDGDFEFLRAGAAIDATLGKHFPGPRARHLPLNYPF